MPSALLRLNAIRRSYGIQQVALPYTSGYGKA